MSEQKFKYFEIKSILKRGTNFNKYKDKNETFFVAQLSEISSETINGRKIFNGRTINKTFLENDEGGWINLLEEVYNQNNPAKIEELPLFKGYIHECTTPPFYVQTKDSNGNKQLATYDTSHEDAGKYIIANKFKLLLSSDENADTAVNDFLGRQKMVDLASVDTTKQEYTVGGKAYNILNLNDNISETSNTHVDSAEDAAI